MDKEEKNNKKFSIPMQFQMIDAKELTGYLEAQAEDLQSGMKKMIDSINVDRKSQLMIPDSELKKIKFFAEAIDKFNQKEFSLNMPDFSGLEGVMKTLISVMQGFKFPTEMTLKKMPNLNIPAPEVNIDVASFVEAINKLKDAILTTKLQTEISNIGEFPMMLSQHAAKVLAEASPIIHKLTLTDANVEYTKAITAPTKGITMQGRGDYDIKIKFSDGGNFWTIKSGSALEINGYQENVIAESASAGAILEIIEIH
ncbi:MAG TPA: hypothetical protein ENH35_02945 [Candidatus Moranbacteria bacterium]|nr:hypothetical protein [Candidatus Moranbacteria bacterium]